MLVLWIDGGRIVRDVWEDYSNVDEGINKYRNDHDDKYDDDYEFDYPNTNNDNDTNDPLPKIMVEYMDLIY